MGKPASAGVDDPALPQDVLNVREFELVLEACGELPSPRGFEARFIGSVGGRLGLRAGKIAHFWTDWVDWIRKLIRLPKHEPCDCGYCHRHARKEAAHNKGLTASVALRTRWHPKTVASARSICRYVSSCVVSGWPTGLRGYRGPGRRLLAEYMPLPSRRNSKGGCIHTGCARPRPATTPTWASPRSHSRC